MLVSSTSGTAPLPVDVRATPVQRPAKTTTEPAPALPIAVRVVPEPLEPEQAVAKLNEFTGMVAQGIQFSIDEDSGRTLVKVIDTATQEVLRQFPTKEALSLARALDKMQGLLIHDKA
jgi:flagellar protein FlaG